MHLALTDLFILKSKIDNISTFQWYMFQCIFTNCIKLFAIRNIQFEILKALNLFFSIGIFNRNEYKFVKMVMANVFGNLIGLLIICFQLNKISFLTYNGIDLHSDSNHCYPRILFLLENMDPFWMALREHMDAVNYIYNMIRLK